MMCVKETVRLYKSLANANHGMGALKRFGWEVRGVPEQVELAGKDIAKHLSTKEIAKLPKGTATNSRVVWQVHAVRGLSFLIRMYDAYMAARATMLKVLKSA